MNDVNKYVQQANELAALLAKGKPLAKAAQIVARRWARKGQGRKGGRRG